MKVSSEDFRSLCDPDGPDICFSFYHDCLRPIALEHIKIITISHADFIDTSSQPDQHGEITVKFIRDWRKEVILPAFRQLFGIHVAPQLGLHSMDYQAFFDAIDHLSDQELSEVLSLSPRRHGTRMQILRPKVFLSQLCNWDESQDALSYFIHFGGEPMMLLGNIFSQSGVQDTVLRMLDLLTRSSSASSHRSRKTRSSKSHRSSVDSKSRRSSVGSRSGMTISVSRAKNSPSTGVLKSSAAEPSHATALHREEHLLLPATAHMMPDGGMSPEDAEVMLLAPPPKPKDLPIEVTTLDSPPMNIARRTDESPSPIRILSRSTRFPLVDLSDFDDKDHSMHPHIAPHDDKVKHAPCTGPRDDKVKHAPCTGPRDDKMKHTSHTSSKPAHYHGMGTCQSTTSTTNRVTPACAPSTFMPSSTVHMPTPIRSNKPSPAAWDQFAGSRPTYRPPPISLQGVLRDRAENPRPTINMGHHWSHFVLDTMDPDPVLDPETRSIPPWYAYRPDSQAISINFPAAIPYIHVDRRIFLSAFNRVWESKTQTEFLKNFPILPAKCTSADFLPFYNRVVPHYHGYCIYVPPLTTLRPNDQMGSWFSSLSPDIQADCLHHFSTLLLTALRQKSTGLIGHHDYEFVVLGSDDGYLALYQLAQLGGHPLLNPYDVPPSEPVQHADVSLPTYSGLWAQYLNTRALSGWFLSDRFFVIRFLAGLHPTLRTHVGPYLETYLRDYRYHDQPLPVDFTPTRLWIRIFQQAKSTLGAKHAILDAPREPSRNSLVHQVNQGREPDPDLLSDLSSVIPLESLVAALTHNGPSCFFCRDPKHAANTCQYLLQARSDPLARRILVRLLQDSSASNTNPGTKP